jgi:iron complex transport system ATP-binding protein
MRARLRLPGRPIARPAALVPGEVAVTARGLGRRVGPSWLLRDVDLDVVAGRLLAVVGPNGAGKSTLLSLLAGDVGPSTGHVTVRGVDAGSAPSLELARVRAVLGQRHELAFPFLVREVVRMGRSPWVGTPAEDDDDRVVADAIRTADLDTFTERRHPTLSGGEQARTAFARVLAQQTSVLFLDEPTAALDLRHQEALMTATRQLADAGHAVVVVLHDLEVAAAYADDVAVVASGRLDAVGPPPDVLTADRIERVYGLPVDVVPHPVDGSLVISPRRTVRA